MYTKYLLLFFVFLKFTNYLYRKNYRASPLICIILNLILLLSKTENLAGDQDKPTSGTFNTVLNADSIYSTTYAVLCLTLRLHANDFYTLQHRSLIPRTEVTRILCHRFCRFVFL